MTTDASRPPGRQRRAPLLRRLAKLIGGAVAVIAAVSAFIGYINNGTEFFAQIDEYFRGRSQARVLIDAAKDRLAYADYQAAWQANARARQLSPSNGEAAAQQQLIAMRWLEDMRLSSAGGPKSFSEAAEPLKAVLIERLPAAQGREKADIQAHIGWADFLRYRDGLPAAGILEEFDAALREDHENMYGHVMRGFWILWNGGPIDKARPDLESALASTVDPRYTDTMVMSALTNITSDEFKAASVEFANKIRRADRNIDDDAKGTLIWYYEISLHSAETLKAISEAVPAGEQVLVLDWLRQAEVREPEKRVATYYMAYFLERDGRADEALPIYKELMRPQPDGDDYVARFARANALGIENGRGKR